VSVHRSVLFASCLALSSGAWVGAIPGWSTEARAAEPGAVGHAAPRVPLGGDPVDLWFAVWDGQGSPALGAVGRATADVGTVDQVVEVGGGLYKARFTPPEGAPGGVATVEWTAKDPVSKRPLTATVTVPLAPSRAAPKAGANPPALVLGRDASAALTAQSGGRAGLVWRASAGAVSESKPSEGSLWTATYTPPGDRPPRVALLTFGDAADPLARAGHLALELSGAIDFPVKGEPGASVLLEVAGERFGPAILGADGRGKVPIVAPPGVTAATKVTVANGAETREAFDLKIPQARRIALYPLPAALPSDGRSVELRAVVVTPGGDPDPAAPVVFTVFGGTVSEARPGADGVYRATWTLPSGAAGSARVSASLGTPEQTDAVDVAFGPPQPAAVTVRAEGEGVKPGDVLRVTVAATWADGRPFTIGEPAVDLDGADLKERVREGDAWLVRGDVAPEGPVRATARWQTAPSPNPAAALALVPERTALAPGGDAKLEVWVRAVDAYGSPVAGRVVALTVEGDARVEPAEVTTRDDGTARATVTAGATAGWLTLRARSQDLDQVQTLAQFPGARPPAALPPSRTPELVATLPTLGVARADAAAAAAEVDPWGVGVAAVAPPITPPAPPPVAPPPAPPPVADVPGVPEVTAVPEVPGAPRPDRSDVAGRWLRARGSGVAGTYRFTQAPSSSPGPVLPAVFAVGGPDGGSAATPVGGEGDLRVWLDPLGAPWLGVHGQVRAAGYSVASEAFSNEAADSLVYTTVDVVGRYPFGLGGDTVWVGAKVGYQYSDLLTFQGDLTPGSTVRFVGVPVHGLGLGPEVGAELGPVHLVAGYALGLAGGTRPWSNTVDVEAGVELVDHLFVATGLTTVSRDAELAGGESGLTRGTVDDASLQFKLGVGLSL
jgi:hypothetical protein